VISLIAFVAAVLTASAAFGAVGGHVLDAPGTETGSPCETGTDRGTTTPPTDPEAIAQNEDPSSCAGEEPTAEPTNSTDEPSTGGTDEPTGGPAPTTTPDPQRAADCGAAAGLTPGTEAAPALDGGTVTGLDNAISHVLANCNTNVTAPGLPIALAHLAHNRERQAAHKAEIAAAKAARSATHAGRVADGGNGGDRGNGGNGLGRGSGGTDHAYGAASHGNNPHAAKTTQTGS
jgi:hypothetical protein